MDGANDYEWLVKRLGEFMHDQPKDERWFGTGGVPDGDIQVHSYIDGEGNSMLDGKLVTDPPYGSSHCVTRFLFSFKRKKGRRGWHLNCDEKLVSHWLWKELVRLERRDDLCELSEAEKDLILEDNLNQL